MNVTKIEFYSTNGNFGEFSNFARFPIFLKGRLWPTSEHYFQAQKFAGINLESKIRKAKTPALAATMGRDRRNPIRKDWESIKENVMKDALRAKFSQHPKLKKLLLDTENSILIEHTPNDNYWGDGGNGNGKNRLGYLLMQIREELRNST